MYAAFIKEKPQAPCVSQAWWQVGAATGLVPHEMQAWMAGPTMASRLHLRGFQAPGPRDRSELAYLGLGVLGGVWL